MDRTDFIDDDLSPEREMLGDLAEVRALNACSENELVGQIDDADCIMMYHFVTLGSETIARIKHCKLIVRCGVGVDNVDSEAARNAGIDVCNVPDYGTEEVADSAVALMLALVRGTHLLNSRLRAGRCSWHYSHAVPLLRIRSRTFGIVGMGHRHSYSSSCQGVWDECTIL